MPQTTFADLANKLDGLAQLCALGGALCPINETLDFALFESDVGPVVFEGTPWRSVFNPMGTVHGGYAATLLDSACGCAGTALSHTR